jgi:hypothetical protein
VVCSKAPEHDADHGETDERSNGSSIAFEVACQPAVATKGGRPQLPDKGLLSVLPCGAVGLGLLLHKSG